MLKKYILVLVLAAIVAGGVFAQEADVAQENDAVQEAKPAKKEYKPRSTLTVDVGPLLGGLVFGATDDVVNRLLRSFGANGLDGFEAKAFGIGAQYEFDIVEKLSVAGRFAYFGGDVGFGLGTKEQGKLDNFGLNLKVTSFSIEGHIRYYPYAGSFFIDGMLGYANMTTGFTGKVEVGRWDSGYEQKKSEEVDFELKRDFFKFGFKLGWRLAFGSPVGFVFEPSLGWSFGIGGNNTAEKQLKEKVGGDIGNTEEWLKYTFMFFEQGVFVGGPRLSLAFGVRF